MQDHVDRGIHLPCKACIGNTYLMCPTCAMVDDCDGDDEFMVLLMDGDDDDGAGDGDVEASTWMVVLFVGRCIGIQRISWKMLQLQLLEVL